MSKSQSSFASPMPGLRIKEAVFTIPRPSKEEMAVFPHTAKELYDRTWSEQVSIIMTSSYSLQWIRGRHFLLAGGTGSGLGGAVATAVMNLVGDSGSVTILSRDPRHSLGYHCGLAMEEQAHLLGLQNRFQWLNTGMGLEGEILSKIISALKSMNVSRLVYVNTVAAASSGMLPGFPPVYVKDVDERGLFQWRLSLLSEKSIAATKFMMGTLAVHFPEAIEDSGFKVEATAFADWRGSLDRLSRDPNAIEYGRNGPYSTSLYLPKEILQEATTAAYGSGKTMIDIFFPLMKTRALSLIPGGLAMYRIYDKLMEEEGIQRIDIPELALAMLDKIGRAVHEGNRNPFPRLDGHEAVLDFWFSEILKRLNDNENSEFYFKKWIV